MSQAPSTSTSTFSSNFQSIFNAALRAYRKKTKKDLLAHPLAAQLRACNSPADVLAVLQDKVNEFEESRSADERLSRWLSPTINVLYAFAATLGQGVGLVGPIPGNLSTPTPLIPIFQVFSPANVIFAGVGVLLSVNILLDPCLPTLNSVTGSQGCRSEPRRPRRSLWEHRELLQAPRVLYRSASDRRHDGHNCEDYGRSAGHPRNCNEGDKARSSEWVVLCDI